MELGVSMVVEKTRKKTAARGGGEAGAAAASATHERGGVLDRRYALDLLHGRSRMIIDRGEGAAFFERESERPNCV